jgi:phage tail-like protein
MPGPLKDPVATLNFALEIQSIQTAFFREAEGFSNETEVIEHRQQGKDGKVEVIKIPGNTKWGNIVLKRGIIDDQSLWNWRKKVLDGDIKGARKDGSVVGYDDKGTEMIRYNFKNGWPCKWEASGMNAGGNEVIIETIEIAHEGLERVK